MKRFVIDDSSGCYLCEGCRGSYLCRKRRIAAYEATLRILDDEERAEKEHEEAK